MPSLSASSFTTTAPRMDISRVETESEMVGLAAGGGVPAEAEVVIVGVIVRAVRIETDENPARVPPTRVTGFAGGFAGTGFGTGAAGAGFCGGAFFAGCCFGAGGCFWDSFSFSFFGFADGRARRSLPCK